MICLNLSNKIRGASLLWLKNLYPKLSGTSDFLSVFWIQTLAHFRAFCSDCPSGMNFRKTEEVTPLSCKTHQFLAVMLNP